MTAVPCAVLPAISSAEDVVHRQVVAVRAAALWAAAVLQRGRLVGAPAGSVPRFAHPAPLGSRHHPVVIIITTVSSNHLRLQGSLGLSEAQLERLDKARTEFLRRIADVCAERRAIMARLQARGVAGENKHVGAGRSTAARGVEGGGGWGVGEPVGVHSCLPAGCAAKVPATGPFKSFIDFTAGHSVCAQRTKLDVNVVFPAPKPGAGGRGARHGRRRPACHAACHRHVAAGAGVAERGGAWRGVAGAEGGVEGTRGTGPRAMQQHVMF